MIRIATVLARMMKGSLILSSVKAEARDVKTKIKIEAEALAQAEPEADADARLRQRLCRLLTMRLAAIEAEGKSAFVFL